MKSGFPRGDAFGFCKSELGRGVGPEQVSYSTITANSSFGYLTHTKPPHSAGSRRVGGEINLLTLQSGGAQGLG